MRSRWKLELSSVAAIFAVCCSLIIRPNNNSAMKSISVISALVAVFLTDKTIHAFSPSLSSVVEVHRRTSTRIYSTDEARIKKAGAGITKKAPGDLCVYDPNEGGKLKGSNSLMNRIEKGASYMSSQTPSPPTPAAYNPTPAPAAAKAKQNPFSNLRNLMNGQQNPTRGTM